MARRNWSRRPENSSHHRQEEHSHARYLQPGQQPGLGGYRSKAPRRSLSRRVRDATYGPTAGVAGNPAQHWYQHFCRAPYHLSAGNPYRIQPRHCARRLLATGSAEEPHRNRRTGGNLQHHVRGTRAIRARPQACRYRKSRAVHGIDPDAGRRGRRKGSLHSRPLRPCDAVLAC